MDLDKRVTDARHRGTHDISMEYKMNMSRGGPVKGSSVAR